MLALTFVEPADYDWIQPGDVLTVADTATRLRKGDALEVADDTRHEAYALGHGLTARHVDVVLQGSLRDAFRRQQSLWS